MCVLGRSSERITFSQPTHLHLKIRPPPEPMILHNRLAHNLKIKTLQQRRQKLVYLNQSQLPTISKRIQVSSQKTKHSHVSPNKPSALSQT